MEKYVVRNAHTEEFKTIGKLMVDVYSSLEGFPNPDEQPKYYNLLANIGELTKQTHTELLVAVSSKGLIGGAVVYFSDMSDYGAGGIAKNEKNASGYRLLAVSTQSRGLGLGKQLINVCIEKAKNHQHTQVIIHSTKSMKVAWGMYEKIGFNRSEDLDFKQGDLNVYGFRLKL